MTQESLHGHHQAVIISEKGAQHSRVSRKTPQPGPGQLLIEVKAVALNPVDHFQRDSGLLITNYPTVLGSDVAGIVVECGPEVPADTPQPGARVAAYATAFFHQSDADFGAFQKFVLVNAERVTPLPDSTSFSEGSILPMSVAVALVGWHVLGIPHDISYKPEDKQGILVWGASTSVGSAAVQSAKLLGFRVYATSSPGNHDYLKTLGADQTFDYKSDNIVSQVVEAARTDGVSLNYCFLGQGSLEPIANILGQLKSDRIPKIASAPIVPPAAKDLEGVEVIFILPPMNDPKELYNIYHWVFMEWLKEKLATGEYVPSPRVKVVGKGLEDIDKALEELKQGVSGTKLVVEL
jgi:NADPH:quinone reductase-like Zn-dependent oxidoreductase